MGLFLQSTDTIQVITSAAGQVDCSAFYSEVSGTGSSATVDVSRQQTRITTAATTTILGSPTAPAKRNIKAMRVSNNHATVTQTVQVVFNDGTLAIPLENVSLAPGEAISYNEGSGMRVLGSNGVEKAAIGGLLTTGGAVLNVTANAADTYVGGFQGAGRIQAGTMVTWRVSITKTAAGAAAPVFTFRTGTGTTGAVADTSRVALTSPFAQTAVADSGTLIAWAVLRSHGSGTTGVMVAGYQFGHALAATGLGTQPSYGQAGTSAGFDTTSSSLIIGLSINPGTAGVWTMDSSYVATDLVA